jgi:uncharacterized protein DUF3223
MPRLPSDRPVSVRRPSCQAWDMPRDNRWEMVLDDTRRGWKTKARDRCREIIGTVENGELVKDDDTEFLLWLLDRHPRAAEKVGCGVAGFTVQDAQIDTRCFVVHRADGSSTDFSFYSCITAPDSIVLVRRRCAVRFLIR